MLEEDPDPQAAEEFRAEVVEWLQHHGAWPEAESEERALLAAAVGSIPDRDGIRTSWRGEGVAVLVWALELADLPPYDETVSSVEVASSVRFLEEDAESIKTTAKLRSLGEIEEYAAFLGSVYARIISFDDRRELSNKDDATLERIFGPSEKTGVKFVAGDLAFGGRSLTEAPASLLDEFRSIVIERFTAVNWLLGEEELYSDITLDT